MVGWEDVHTSCREVERRIDLEHVAGDVGQAHNAVLRIVSSVR
jgi:hypothetical protein